MDINDPVTVLGHIGPAYSKRLAKLDIYTVSDLLFHIPSRYIDFRQTVAIPNAKIGELVTITGKIENIVNQYTRNGKKIQIMEISDRFGKILAVWFNQPYLLLGFKKNSIISLAGEVSFFGRRKALISPEYEITKDNDKTIHTGRLMPIYSETKGLSSKFLRLRINNVWEKYSKMIDEYLPKQVLYELKYPSLSESIRNIHFPQSLKEAEIARDRLAFDELLFLQIRSLKNKSEWQKYESTYKLAVNKTDIVKFVNNLPFTPTNAQLKAFTDILNDLTKSIPMNRLLEGDVGSGKTVVAAFACYISFINGYQSIIMAPTQILAQQHYETIKHLFKKLKIRISLTTSAKKIHHLGRNDIFIGTHALLHNDLKLDNVALIVIDEQHKFGVKQRSLLIKKSKNKTIAPHVLTMTATPIPRTVALTAYGDLDLSILDEMPKGRQKITTWIVPNEKRSSAYKWIEEKIIKEKLQVFIVCPLIEESVIDTMKQIKAVKTEYEKLKKEFSKFNLGLMHGKLKAKEKDKTIDDFKSGKTNILVSTPVIEVGIDIAGANIMIIEAADRFGLAQLHQLRGRIGRGTKKAYCLLFTESKSERVVKRLNALKNEDSGFVLSEIDLALRGPGELYGLKQHGFPELKIASWQDINLVKKTKRIAIRLFNDKKLLNSIYSHITKYSIFN